MFTVLTGRNIIQFEYEALKSPREPHFGRGGAQAWRKLARGDPFP